jgi:hypothetical protein
MRKGRVTAGNSGSSLRVKSDWDGVANAANSEAQLRVAPAI